MKNFPIIDKVTGREYWISRSVCAVILVFAKNKYGDTCILTTQRGKGTPDKEFIGAYCAPCGYVEYDETIIQAAARELKEETGLTFPNTDFKLIKIMDDPTKDKRQNISFRYIIKSKLTVEELELLTTTKNSEKDEVSSIRFININNIDLYEWAFNHDEIIKEIQSLKI